MSDIGADKIRVGFAVVSSWIGDTMNLTSGSVKDDILIRVDGIKQQQEGSRTDVGIAFLDEMFYKQGEYCRKSIKIKHKDISNECSFSLSEIVQYGPPSPFESFCCFQSI